MFLNSKYVLKRTAVLQEFVIGFDSLIYSKYVERNWIACAEKVLNRTVRHSKLRDQSPIFGRHSKKARECVRLDVSRRIATWARATSWIYKMRQAVSNFISI